MDEARATEKFFLPTPISLSNIYQARIVFPGVRAMVVGASPDAVRTALNANLGDAKLFFDGISIPAKLKPLADDIEVGIYEDSVSQLAAVAAKAPKDVGDAAKAMFERVKPLADALVEEAKAREGEGKKYDAYVAYAKLASWFKKTDYEKPAVAALVELKKDKTVSDELTAQQLLAQARSLLSSGKKADKAGAAGILAALQKKYPNSEAAKAAAKLAASAK